MTDVPHNYCNWMMHLITVQKFIKANLFHKIKVLLFRSTIFALCVKILMPNQRFKKYFLCKQHTKIMHLVCEDL